MENKRRSSFRSTFLFRVAPLSWKERKTRRKRRKQTRIEGRRTHTQRRMQVFSWVSLVAVLAIVSAVFADPCSWTAPDGKKYDLSPIKGKPQASTSSGTTFTWNPCTVISNCGGEVPGATVCQNPPAHNAGSLASESWAPLPGKSRKRCSKF